MSEMNARESIERFSESLKLCVSRSRELARMQSNPEWLKIAVHFEQLLAKGESFYRQKALTKQETIDISEQVLRAAASDSPSKS